MQVTKREGYVVINLDPPSFLFTGLEGETKIPLFFETRPLAFQSIRQHQLDIANRVIEGEEKETELNHEYFIAYCYMDKEGGIFVVDPTNYDRKLMDTNIEALFYNS